MKKPYEFLGIVIGLLLLDFVLSGLYFQWSASEWAGWVQAIGSIAAIIGSFAVANHQHKLASKREDAAQKTNEEKLLRNLIKSIQAELTQHHGRLEGIALDYKNSQQKPLKRQCYPITNFVHPVYSACAAQVGMIDNEHLRTKIIYVYTSLGPFYEMLNRTSELVRRFETLTDLEQKELAAWEQHIEFEATDIPNEIQAIFDITGDKIPENTIVEAGVQPQG